MFYLLIYKLVVMFLQIKRKYSTGFIHALQYTNKRRCITLYFACNAFRGAQNFILVSIFFGYLSFLPITSGTRPDKSMALSIVFRMIASIVNQFHNLISEIVHQIFHLQKIKGLNLPWRCGFYHLVQAWLENAMIKLSILML